MEDTVRVLIADDHPLFREGMRGRLDRVADIAVVGEAASGDEAVELAHKLEPHIILMDIKMPGLNGIEATREIQRANPQIGILVLTMFEDDDSVFSAMRTGARGYVLKGGKPSEILEVVRAVAKGEAHFGPEIACRLTGFFSAPKFDPSEAFPQLTTREREILDLIAQGHSNAKIATRLYLSPKTVRNYISRIFTKLQVADRSQAIVRARESGLGRERT